MGDQVTDASQPAPRKPHMFGFIRNPQDFFGGLALLCMAVIAWWATRELPGQSGFAFGPGTAPRLFMILLALVSIAIMLTASSSTDLRSSASKFAVRFHHRRDLCLCGNHSSARLVVSTFCWFGSSLDRRNRSVGAIIWGAVLSPSVPCFSQGAKCQ